MSDAKTQGPTQPLLRTTLISALGGVFEFYDFVIFAVFATQIGAAFFPPEAGESAQTLKAFLVFAVGYLARPIGGMLWAHVADRRGRAYVFSHTVLGMAAATISIALLPGYATIGAAAPVLLVLLRLLQGMTLGGELPASLCWLAEHAGTRRSGIATATLMAGVNSGMLLGQVVSTTITAVLGAEAAFAWGWRIAFVLGSSVGVIAWFVRRHAGETAAFAQLRLRGVERVPLRTLMRTEAGNAARAAAMCSVHAWVVATLYLALPSFLNKHGGMAMPEAERVSLLCASCGSFLYIVAGWLADRHGAVRVCRAVLAAIAIAAVPCYWLFPSFGVWPLAALGGLGGLFIGAYLCVLPAMFSPGVRSSGLALGYDGSFAIVGGLGPFFMTWLANEQGILSVGLALATLSVVAVLALPKNQVR